RTHADFDAIGLKCVHHSCLMLGYAWQLENVATEARFFLVDDHALAVRVMVRNSAPLPRSVDLHIVCDEAGDSPERHALAGETKLKGQLAPGEDRRLIAVLARGANAQAHAAMALASVEDAYQRILQEDATFLA